MPENVSLPENVLLKYPRPVSAERGCSVVLRNVRLADWSHAGIGGGVVEIVLRPPQGFAQAAGRGHLFLEDVHFKVGRTGDALKIYGDAYLVPINVV